jgi:hypothetical protein
MNDLLVVTETMRFPYRRHEWQMMFMRAKIYLLDWQRKKKLKSIISPPAYHIEEFSSLKRSYHYHGARGVASNAKHVFIAAQNVILVFDHDFNLVGRLQNRLFNGIHEIQWYRNRLYVTCAVTDAVLVLDDKGQVDESFLLGANPFFTKAFGVEPRQIDNALDYRVMHRCQRRYHINSVCVQNGSIYAGFNFTGAFVRISPDEEVLICDSDLVNCHNAQFTPDGDHILINDTQHYALRVFDSQGNLIRVIDLRKFGLPIDFGRRSMFGKGHHIKAGWLRGLAFSVVDHAVVFVGLSPTSIVAVNYQTGELVDFLKLRTSNWITVHGIHNLSLQAQQPPRLIFTKGSSGQDGR